MEKVLIIVGPTGVGKSKVSIELSKIFSGEILSGDAYQCYRELNIGSAKIKEEEKQGIPHYFIDECSYREEVNVKVFQEKGRQAIDTIGSHSHLPIVCGGTGLYIKALVYDYVFEEENNDSKYQELLDTLSNQEAYEKLKQVDEVSAQSLHPNNVVRVKRALMMAHLGQTKSERISKQEHAMLYDVMIVGLSVERAKLYDRINDRVTTMFQEGLKDEVETLVKNPLDFKLQSLRGIGYKEWEAYFNHELDLNGVKELIQKNTRNFAKRQYTWFHNQMDVNWYDMEKLTAMDDIKHDVLKWLYTSKGEPKCE